MIDQPQIVHSTAQAAAIIHLTIPRSEIQKAMGPARAELMAAVAAQGIKQAGPWFSHHLKMTPEAFDFEIGVPVASPVAEAGRVKAGELPARKVARTVYHGGFEGLSGGWSELMAWIAAEGHTPAPDLWEIYVTGPESGLDSASWCTELNRPLID
jgi:effector-binding domain-containing protein